MYLVGLQIVYGMGVADICGGRSNPVSIMTTTAEWPGFDSSVQEGGEIFLLPLPDRLMGSPNLLSSGYREVASGV